MVVVKHLDMLAAVALNPRAGDDAAAVQWMPMSEENLSAMHASHGTIARQAADILRARRIVGDAEFIL